MAAKNGNTVQVHYTGTLDNGKVFDSSVSRDPIEFTIGGQQMIPAFEEAILDMEVGDKKTFNIKAEEAYGKKDDRLIHVVPRSMVPESITPQVGMGLNLQGPDGQALPVTIIDLNDENVTLDANHPLAGENLTFEVELVSIS